MAAFPPAEVAERRVEPEGDIGLVPARARDVVSGQREGTKHLDRLLEFLGVGRAKDQRGIPRFSEVVAIEQFRGQNPAEAGKRMARTADKPYVTIQKKGIIAFNHAAYAALGEPKAVIFLFDRENRVVGFRAADPAEEHAYGVRANTRGTSHVAFGTLFTRHYGISTEVARRWLGRVNDDGTLTIDLKEAPQDVSSTGPGVDPTASGPKPARSGRRTRST